MEINQKYKHVNIMVALREMLKAPQSVGYITSGPRLSEQHLMGAYKKVDVSPTLPSPSIKVVWQVPFIEQCLHESYQTSRCLFLTRCIPFSGDS